jgi:hypothetical protein
MIARVYLAIGKSAIEGALERRRRLSTLDHIKSLSAALGRARKPHSPSTNPPSFDGISFSA